jgi:hypothetical protein
VSADRPAQTAAPGLRGAQLEARLRQPRSKRYIDAVTKLDAGHHHANTRALRVLLDAIAAEFPELTIDQRPLGLVARCMLGAPYEVHICDLEGNIIEHFETYRSMPAAFERARSLAKHAQYAFVEVYADSLRTVGRDGSVAVIKGS